MGSGWSCIRRKGSDGYHPPSPQRDSPFGKLGRSLSSRTSATLRASLPPRERTLLDLTLGIVCAQIAEESVAGLADLPPDLAQALLDRLVECGGLDWEVSGRLQGLTHYRLALPGYPGPVTDEWLETLVHKDIEVINLDRSLMTSKALMRWGSLPRLRVLRLERCQCLTDDGLSALQGFTDLRELSLAGNEQLTQQGLNSVAACTRLSKLSLELCTGVKSLDMIASLECLTSLDLGWCSSLGDEQVRPLAGLRRLRVLVLSHTRVTDAGLATLRTLSCLERLALAHTAVGAPGLWALLPGLPKLKALDLARCGRVGDAALRALCEPRGSGSSTGTTAAPVADGGALIARYPGGTASPFALLTGNDAVGGVRSGSFTTGATATAGPSGAASQQASDPPRMAQQSQLGAPKLEELDLAGTRVRDGGVASLRALCALRRLSLEGCAVGDVGCAGLAELGSLQELDLGDTAVTDTGFTALAAGLPDLTSLSLAFTAVTDAGVSEAVAAGGLRQLQRLGLDCPGVGDAACAALARLPELQELDLFGARITDAGCAHLARCSTLRSLEVCGGGVGDAGVLRLAGLTSLRRLSLAQNPRIGLRALPALCTLRELHTLNLSRTRVGNSAVEGLRLLPQLGTLVLHGTRVRAATARKLQEHLPGLVVLGVAGLPAPH